MKHPPRIPELYIYRGFPDNTVFAHSGNRTIEKTVLIEDWFRTKSVIYAFWIFKVLFIANFHPIWSYWSNFGLSFTHQTTKGSSKNEIYVDLKKIQWNYFFQILEVFKKICDFFFKFLFFTSFFSFSKSFSEKNLEKTVLNRGIRTI